MHTTSREAKLTSTFNSQRGNKIDGVGGVGPNIVNFKCGLMTEASHTPVTSAQYLCLTQPVRLDQRAANFDQMSSHCNCSLSGT